MEQNGTKYAINQGEVVKAFTLAANGHEMFLIHHKSGRNYQFTWETPHGECGALAYGKNIERDYPDVRVISAYCSVCWNLTVRKGLVINNA